MSQYVTWVKLKPLWLSFPFHFWKLGNPHFRRVFLRIKEGDEVNLLTLSKLNLIQLAFEFNLVMKCCSWYSKYYYVSSFTNDWLYEFLRWLQFKWSVTHELRWWPFCFNPLSTENPKSPHCYFKTAISFSASEPHWLPSFCSIAFFFFFSQRS